LKYQVFLFSGAHVLAWGSVAGIVWYISKDLAS